VEFRSHPTDGVLVHDSLPSGNRHALQARTVVVQPLKSVRERSRIAWWHEYSVHLVLHDVWYAPDRGYHRHDAGRHALQQRVRQPFAVTWECEHIGTAPQLLFGGAKNRSEKLHLIAKPSFRDRLSDLLLRRAEACEPQMDLDSASAQHRDGLHDVEDSLTFGETSNVNNFERSIRCIAFEIQFNAFYVNRIRNQR
jgi:hypothetical protein